MLKLQAFARMFDVLRRMAALAAISLASISLFPPAVSGATYTWLGTGNQSNWVDPNNWDPYGVPTNVDTVNISYGAPSSCLVTTGQSVYAGHINIYGNSPSTLVNMSITGLGELTINSADVGMGGNAGFNLTNDATLTSKGEVRLGFTAATNGNVAMNNNAYWDASKISLGMASSSYAQVSLNTNSSVLSRGEVILGATDLANGYVAMSGTSKWTAQAPITIGGGRVGSEGGLRRSRFYVNGSATLTTQAETVIGRGVGSVGDLALTDNTKWTASQRTIIGVSGTGELNLSGNSVVTTPEETIAGQLAGGIGKPSVFGNATWNSGNIVLGQGGTGTLNAYGTGKIYTTGTVRMGTETTSTNTLAYIYNNALWTISSDLTVGERTQLATMRIGNAGRVTTAGHTQIAQYAGSGGRLTVGYTAASTARWEATSVDVGVEGNGRLEIYNGGTVTTSAASAVATTAGGKGYVDIRDANSNWTASADLAIGTGGRGRVFVHEAGTLEMLTNNVTVGGASGWDVNRGWLDVERGTIHANTLVGAATKTGKFNILGSGSTIRFDNGYNAGENAGTYFYVDSTTTGTSIVNVDAGTVNLGGTSYVNAYGMALQNPGAKFQIYSTAGTYAGTFDAPEIKVYSGGQPGTSGVVTVEFDLGNIPTWNINEQSYFQADPERIYMGWAKLQGDPQGVTPHMYFTYNGDTISDSTYDAFVAYLNNGLSAAGLSVELFNRDTKGVEFSILGNLFANSSSPVIGWGLDHFNDLYDSNISLTSPIPTPEPATWAMLLLGVAVVMFRQSRNRKVAK